MSDQIPNQSSQLNLDPMQNRPPQSQQHQYLPNRLHNRSKLQRENKNMLSSNTVTSVKPQLFNFQVRDKPKVNKNVKLYYDHSFTQFVKNQDKNDQQAWRPKLPTKKLLEDPKFLLSLQRKKVRVINGIQTSDVQLQHEQRKRDMLGYKKQSSKIKKMHTSNSKPRSNPSNSSSGYIHHELILHPTNSFRPNRAPIVNFNLHHLIQKRKSFKSERGSRHNNTNNNNNNNNNKQGSNSPYYSYVLSDRFDKNAKNTDSTWWVDNRSAVHSRRTSLDQHSQYFNNNNNINNGNRSQRLHQVLNIQADC